MQKARTFVLSFQRIEATSLSVGSKKTVELIIIKDKYRVAISVMMTIKKR